MKILKTLIISEKKLSKRDMFEIAQAIDVMKIPGVLDVKATYVTKKGLLDSLGTKGSGFKKYPDILKFARDNYSICKNYNAVYVRISEKEWKKKKYSSRVWGLANVYRGTLVATIGKWHKYAKYKRAHRFPQPLNKLSEQALGIWHEFTHGFNKVLGTGLLAWAHSYFYGYDRLYTKAEEKRLNPKRYLKRPDPVSAWRKLDWSKLKSKEIVEIKTIHDNNFNKAVKIILKHEGGYVNNPKDPGGETKYGISKRAYPKLNIKSLTVKDAENIYFRDYWLRCYCNEMNYKAALLVFDMGVNAGVKTSIKLLQKALKVKADGIIGKVTLGAIKNSGDDLYIRFAWQRQLYYQSLSTFKTFGKGWTNRNFESLIESLK